MKFEISVTEAAEVIKEIQSQQEKLFKMIRVDMSKAIGSYLSDVTLP